MINLVGSTLTFDSAAAAPAPGNIDGSVVRGLMFTSPMVGLVLKGGREIAVEGNWFGLGADGGFGGPVGGGVQAFGVDDSRFGGTDAARRNVISGAVGIGLLVQGSRNVIQGNYVGTDASGTHSVPNRVGVWLTGSGNTVGGIIPGARNVVCGSGEAGIRVDRLVPADPVSTVNRIAGNYVGLAADGVGRLGNAGAGVDLGPSAAGNVVGGTDAGAGNVVVGNAVGVGMRATSASDPGGGNRVEGNSVGVTPAGVPFPNGDGVSVAGSSGNVIGGTTAGARNVISGNHNAGINIAFALGSGLRSTRVVGNWIGIAPVPAPGGGVSVVPVRNFVGVTVSGSQVVLLGGPSDGEGNVISGNASDGVRVGASGDVRIAGNKIGTDPAGTAAIGNGADGVLLATFGAVTIGGDTPAHGNLISGNTLRGVEVRSAAATVWHNRIGTDASGAAALRNNGGGVLVAGPTADPAGGEVRIWENLVSGNGGEGIAVAGRAFARIFGNTVGADASGRAALPNTTGILLDDQARADVRDNLVSGNLQTGIVLRGSDGNTITRNIIGLEGLTPAAMRPVPNGGAGINLNEGADDNDITENTIAYNGGPGVEVFEGRGNWIGLNSIYDNSGLGIDLGPPGVTPDDPLDADPGANRLQNFPVITGVFPSDAGITIVGTLDTEPNSGGYRIDVYADSEADVSGHGEGRMHLGFTFNLGTGPDGNVSWSVTAPIRVETGWWVSATASREVRGPLTGETSEFSAAMPVPSQNDRPPEVAQVYFRGRAWGAEFLQALNGNGRSSSRFGYAVPGGPAQLQTLPWSAIDQISVSFTEPVAVPANALAVRGVALPAYTTFGFVYDPARLTATWNLSPAPGADRLTLGLTGVRQRFGDGPDGDALDGEWADGADAYPSGDGSAGGDFRFSVNTLTADADRRGGRVNAQDLAEVKRRLNSTAAGGGTVAYSVFADLDANGTVNAQDLTIVRRNLNHSLPPAPVSFPTLNLRRGDGRASATAEILSA